MKCIVTEAQALLSEASLVDPKDFDFVTSVFAAIVSKSARVATVLFWLWLATLFLELICGVGVVWYFSKTDGLRAGITLYAGGAFGLLLVLILVVLHALRAVAILPVTLVSLASAAAKVLESAKSEYQSVMQAQGWYGSLLAVIYAGKLLYAIGETHEAHKIDAYHGLYSALLITTPLGWIAMAVLMCICIALPVGFGLLILFRLIAS